MEFQPLTNFNLREWMNSNNGDWGPHKVRRIWDDSEFITIVSRGPWNRTEFHINPGDEIFHQLDGELHFHYISPEGTRKVMKVQAGEMFLLPAGVPHSPRRPGNAWTLVVERRRRRGDIDRFAWFCENCNNKLYEISSESDGPSNEGNKALREALETLHSDQKLRTCSKCGDVLPAH